MSTVSRAHAFVCLRKIFFKSESPASDMIDNVPENCGICCGNRMKKENFSVVDAAGDLFKSLLLFRLVFRVPVRIGKTPANCAVIHLLQKGKASFGKSAFRRAEKIHIVSEEKRHQRTRWTQESRVPGRKRQQRIQRRRPLSRRRADRR